MCYRQIDHRNDDLLFAVCLEYIVAYIIYLQDNGKDVRYIRYCSFYSDLPVYALFYQSDNVVHTLWIMKSACLSLCNYLLHNHEIKTILCMI